MAATPQLMPSVFSAVRETSAMRTRRVICWVPTSSVRSSGARPEVLKAFAVARAPRASPGPRTVPETTSRSPTSSPGSIDSDGM